MWTRNTLPENEERFVVAAYPPLPFPPFISSFLVFSFHFTASTTNSVEAPVLFELQ